MIASEFEKSIERSKKIASPGVRLIGARNKVLEVTLLNWDLN